MNKSLLSVMGIMLLLVGCASTKQSAYFPDQSVEIEDSEKSRIYLVRPSIYGSAVSVRITDNGVDVGKTGPKGFLSWEREPGDADIVGHAENKARYSFYTEKGKVYYLKQKMHMGVMTARNSISHLTNSEGKELISKAKSPKI